MQSILRRSGARSLDLRAALTAFAAKLSSRRDRYGFDHTAEICLTDELERKLSQRNARW